MCLYSTSAFFITHCKYFHDFFVFCVSIFCILRVKPQWQKSDSGRISGINGNVDLDEAYMDYPTIIKNAGLNGFKKPENPAPPQNKPAPQTKQPKPTTKVVALTIDGKTYEGTLAEK